MHDWNIQPRSKHCLSCGQPFADKQVYHTVLLTGQPQLQRRDLCAACWDKEVAAGIKENPNLVSYWRGTYVIPPKNTEPIGKESAELLFKKLVSEGTPEWHPVIYILCLFLERKRILKLKKRAIIHDTPTLIYEHKVTGESYTITEPNLTTQELQEAFAKVSNLLDRGLSPLPVDASANQHISNVGE